MKNVNIAPGEVRVWHTRPRVCGCKVIRPLATAASLFLQMLREIFDEAAYARFLARHSVTRSRESYAAFLRENGFRRERRPRCC